MTFTRALVFAFTTVFSFSICSVVASELLDTSIRQQRCSIGVCFAIDGSASISERGFERQTFLAEQIIGNIPTSSSASFAAAQYGISNQAISELTSNRSFIQNELGDAEQLSSNGTFVTAGLNFCFSQLFDVVKDTPVCRRSIVVLMGNGIGDIGTDPVERARMFEGEVGRGDVLAVRFGFSANFSQLEAISSTGDVFDAFSNPISSLATEIVESLRI